MSRTFTPVLRSSFTPQPSGNLKAPTVDANFIGALAVANAATFTALAANAAARLALGAAVQVGDLCLQLDTSATYLLKALPASTSGNWVAVGGGGGGMTNPMTTEGDLITGASAGAAQRIGIGTSGQVLEVVGGVPAWATPAAFLASGVSHAPGAVPDPGAIAGTSKFLREDATFAVPSGNNLGIPPWFLTEFTPPIVANFAWTNQGAATATDQTAQLTFVSSGTGSNSMHILDQAYTVGHRAVCVVIPAFTTTGAVLIAGIILRNSSTGKFLEFSISITGSTGTMALRGVAWASPTDPSPTVIFSNTIEWCMNTFLMLSVHSDGTNIMFDISFDGGQNWDNYFTETVAAFLLATDRAGFHSSSVASAPTRANFVHWSNS